jgi:hypothetical protein
MSFKALAWAVEQDVPNSADKLILLGLADRYNEEICAAYPSVEWLEHFGSLNRKTVILALQRLEGSGLISDTGRRTGRTKQIKLYALTLERVPKLEQYQKRNSTNLGAKQSQKRDTEPVRNRIEKKGKERARGIDDNWMPTLAPETKTRKFTDTWPDDFFESELERFVAYHQAHDTKSKNWNKQWTTWALGPYCREALKEWNSERANGSQSGSALVRAAARAIGAAPS